MRPLHMEYVSQVFRGQNLAFPRRGECPSNSHPTHKPFLAIYPNLGHNIAPCHCLGHITAHYHKHLLADQAWC